ncbi:MAG: hypothetical protein DRP13_04595 [Candidatus Aenigmatarchaeota archaeon]|nr:MAG: hypothetical protein DRP13_04595 [Candidatus Aenigmarchaeota archaeon]
MKWLFWLWFTLCFLLLVYSFFKEISLSNILNGMLLVGMGLLAFDLEKATKIKKSILKKLRK